MSWHAFADAAPELATFGTERLHDRRLPLNPTRRGADGEWEAYYLAHWDPGIEPYPSFRHLMDEERRRSSRRSISRA